MSTNDEQLLNEYGRLTSLDAYRGLTMFLLVADGTGLYHAFLGPGLEGTWLSAFFTQFTHHPWNGLRFWDLVQPFFMFIVGVAMPFSFEKRWARGDTYWETFRHAGSRSLILLALGVGVYVVSAGELVLEFWNVLAQLGFTYFVAFLIMRKSTRSQILVSLGLLVFTEAIYRMWPVAGFDRPFTPDENFGAWLDLIITGHLSGGHWVAFNAVPTAAHTIWGVLAGYCIKSDRDPIDRVKILAGWGVALIVAGYALDPITPIVKRIATTSFTIVTGGWCLVVLAFFFWFIDMKGYRRWTYFGVVFGMNPLFIYLFSLLGGDAWLEEIVLPFTEGFLGWTGPMTVEIVTALVVLWIEWRLVKFLYERRIFIKI